MKETLETEAQLQNGASDANEQAEPGVPVEPSTLTAPQLEELKQRAAKADERPPTYRGS